MRRYSKMNESTKTVVGFILNIEAKYDLLNYQINSIYFWKLIRMKFYLDLMQQTGQINEAHPNKKIKSFQNLYLKLRREVIIILENASRNKSCSKTVVFSDPRKQIINGNLHDKYTYYLNEELLDYKVFELQATQVGYDFDSNIAINPRIKSKILGFFSSIKLNENDKSLLHSIEQEVYNRFSIKYHISIVNILRGFLMDMLYYKKLFSKQNVRKIYIVSSYGLEPIIAAAHSQKIEVIEIQHGTISKYHLGYSFPNNSKVPYFPDKLLLFGKFWRDITPFPECIIEYVGFPYLELNIKKYKNSVKAKNTVLFVSQGTIGCELLRIAFDFAKENKCYTVWYKLHPSEYSSWEVLYPILHEAVKLCNFTLLKNNEADLYEVLSKSEFQVGVSSTVLYEGLAFNVKSILISLPEVEHMEDLIKNKYVMVAKDDKDLLNCIKNFKVVEYSRDIFFK